MTQRDCGDCYYSKLEGEKEPCKSCKATDEGFTNWREVPLTNADCIHSMSDEELAEFLIELADDGNLRIRDWLQQPAEDSANG